MNVKKLTFLISIFLFLAGCSDDDDNSNNRAKKRRTNPTPELPLSFTLDSRHTAHANKVALVFEEVEAGDALMLWRNSTCSGDRERDTTLSEGETADGVFRVQASFNPDILGTHSYSARIRRDGKESACVTQEISHQTATVVAGGDHTCGILQNGLLKCWGDGSDGRLGNGAAYNLGGTGVELYPVRIGSDFSVVVKKVVLGRRHTCALMSDHQVRCWGSNRSGQIGWWSGGTNARGDSGEEMTSLEAVDLGTVGGEPVPVWDIFAGANHTCALVGENAWALSVKCWGYNIDGQLGLGDINSRGDADNEMGDALPALELGSKGSVVALDGGLNFTCALFDDGSVRCWGERVHGQLGLNTVPTGKIGDESGEMGDSLVAVALGESDKAMALSAGNEHACVILQGGAVKCWGSNTYGQLGLGDTDHRGDQNSEMGDALPAVDLGTGRTAIAISAGRYHTCAILDNASLKCWGNNTYGQLGQGDNDNRGDNADEMGDDLASLNFGTRTVVGVSAGGSHTCAALSDDSILCWGRGTNGQLLQENNDEISSVESLKAADTGDTGSVIRDASMGTKHACAIFSHGRVKCWGDNQYGQLGQGNINPVGASTNGSKDEVWEIAPVDLGRGRTATKIAVGRHHSCALVRDGRGDEEGVVCWGKNDVGQLGRGEKGQNRGDQSSEMGDALRVIRWDGKKVLEMGAGEDFTCVLLDSNEIRCWGQNDQGQLGAGNTTVIGDDETVSLNTTTAVGFPGSTDPAALRVGRWHACAILDDARLICWGDNGSGQLGQASSGDLGDNESVGSVSPIDFGSTDTVTSASAGDEHTCAVLTAGATRCWGEGAAGRLGRNSETDVTGSPTTGDINFGLSRTINGVVLGSAHSCGIVSSWSSIACWGLNASGQLGIGHRGNVGTEANLVSNSIFPFLSTERLILGGEQTCILGPDRLLRCWGNNASGQLGVGNVLNRGGRTGKIIFAENLDAINAFTPQVNDFPLTVQTLASHVSTLFVSATDVEEGTRIRIYENTICSGSPGQELVASSEGDFDFEIPFNSELSQQRRQFSAVVVKPDGARTACLSKGSFALTLEDTTSIVAGGSHSCAILDNGLLKCWGLGSSGQLGTDATESIGDASSEDGANLHPVRIGSDPGLLIKKVVLGDNHTCALMEDYTLRCWGDNSSGQLGYEDTDNRGDDDGEMADLAAVDLGRIRGVGKNLAWDVSAGSDHTCALVGRHAKNLSVKCWGENSQGALGQESTSATIGGSSSEMGDDLPVIDLGTDVNPRYIGSGDNFNCVLFADGSVKCWGNNQVGQLGLGHANDKGESSGDMGDALPVVDLGTNLTARSISVGFDHVCAHLSDNTVRCWGSNQYGQLGIGNITSPKDIIGNESGEMGDALVAVDLGGKRVASLSSGFGYSCALFTDNSVKCWGYNVDGRLGVGDANNRGDGPGEMGSALPALSFGSGKTVLALSAGFVHACALLNDKSVRCWGSGSDGRLLSGATADINAPPIAALGLDYTDSPVRDFDMGETHACAVFGKGKVKCWGKNNYGQLGQGNTSSVGHATSGTRDELDEITAVDLGPDVTAVMVATGSNHSCAVVKNVRGEANSVRCWGKGDVGQLGNGRSDNLGDGANEMGENLESITFQSKIMNIQAGDDFTCVQLVSNDIQCWGKNDVGQLGRGDTLNIGDDEYAMGNMSWIELPGNSRPGGILSLGANHACASLSDDTLFCWGSDGDGQLGQSGSDNLGDDESISGLDPIDFGSTDTIVDVSAGEDHTCARLTVGR